MSACRARRPRRSEPILSNAARTSACQCRRDAGWPCKRGAHRALAVPFRRSHHAPRSWPFARGGSARVSRPPGRRSSSSSQCGSTAATAPRRGRPQARRPTALDGALSAFERAARPTGRSVRCRGARRRERTSTGTRACPMPRLPLTAGAHRCAGGRCARGWRRRSAPARGREARRVASVKLCRRHGRRDCALCGCALWSSEWQSHSQTSVTQCWQSLEQTAFN